MALLFKVLKYPTLLGGAFGASYLGYESYMADGYSVSKKPCSGKSVVVVGGGVAGVSSAYYLARQGYAVTLLDKDPDLGLGASSLNAGWHRTQSHAPLTSPGTVKSVIKSLGVSEGESVLLVWPSYFLRDPEWMRFGARFMGAVMSSAMRAFFSDYCLHLSKFSADLLVEVAKEEGLADVEWDREDNGWYHMILDNPAMAANLNAPAAMANKQGFPTTVYSLPETKEKLASTPYVGRMQGMAYEETPFIGDCQKWLRRLAEISSEKYGAKFVGNTSACSLKTSGGKVTGVDTVDGRHFPGDIVVLAAGAWTADIAATAGVSVPVIPAKGYSMEFSITEEQAKSVGPAPALFSNSGLAMTVFASEAGKRKKAPAPAPAPAPEAPAPEGAPPAPESAVAAAPAAEELKRIRFSTAAEFSPMSLPGRPAMANYLRRNAKEVIPSLAAEIDVQHVRMGARPQTPDDLPIVSGTKYPNLFINSGGCSYGWRWGPGMGAMLAHAVCGKCPATPTPMPAPAGMSLDRFSMGTYLGKVLGTSQ